MRASSGEYYFGLDHVRAVAIFLVFCWHFIHVGNWHLQVAPNPLLAVFVEGHTGVALFMTLSGYLFAKLLENKKIHWGYFLWNRFLRLAPLLTLVFIICGISTQTLLEGFIYPVWPYGGWSIAIEIHFYLLLPFLLFLMRLHAPAAIMLIIASALILRTMIYLEYGKVQTLAYWTMIGRIDQFVLGMAMFYYRRVITEHRILALLTLVSFLAYYWHFDHLGGFYKNQSHSSPSPLWIFHPTIEGIAYAILIAWYDHASQSFSKNRLSRYVSYIGQCSYSMYLLDTFFIDARANLLSKFFPITTNLYLCLLIAVPNYLLIALIGRYFLSLFRIAVSAVSYPIHSKVS